jgi:hypothetical protein
MADGFEFVNLPTSGFNEDNREVKYFAELYDESLSAYRSYMDSLREHLDLLYGAALVDRIGRLGLDEGDMRLSGLLVQLALDERVSMLDGYDFLRLWRVDLLSLIGCTSCSCANLVSRFSGALDADMDICITSVEVVYGESASSAFRPLSMVLLKCGRSFPDAVKEILDGRHGPYFHWGQAFLQLDAECTAKRNISFGTLGLDSMMLDDAADADR